MKRWIPDLSRREFIILAGQATLMIGLGGLIRISASDELVLRPPKAIPEKDFLAVCVKCQRCAEVCLTGVINQLILEDDVLGFGTPRLDFGLGYCTLCMKCVEVCPSGALYAGAAEKEIFGVAEINAAVCIAWSWGGCTKCQQVCTYGAISLDDDGRPVIDSTRCTACGQCQYECPSSSLRSGIVRGSKGIMVMPERG